MKKVLALTAVLAFTALPVVAEATETTSETKGYFASVSDFVTEVPSKMSDIVKENPKAALVTAFVVGALTVKVLEYAMADSEEENEF